MEIGKITKMPLWRAAIPVRRRLADAAPNRGPSMKRWATVLPFCLGLLVSACSSTAAANKDSTTTTSSSAVTSTTADSQATVVLAAYRAGWVAFEQAIRTANAFSSGLPATMVDPELQSARRYLLTDAHDGIVGRGAVTLHPKIPSINGKSAVVVDCIWDASELVYKATGKPVPPITPPEHAGVRTRLVEVSTGRWKVASQSVIEGKCAAGY
jgi:hypothetical protein